MEARTCRSGSALRESTAPRDPPRRDARGRIRARRDRCSSPARSGRSGARRSCHDGMPHGKAEVRRPVFQLQSSLDLRRDSAACARAPQPRHRHPIGRGADVVQADLVEEMDRRRIAAVLAADADLQIGPRLPAELDADLRPARRRLRRRSTRTDPCRGSSSPGRCAGTCRRRRARSRRSAGSGRWCRTRRTAPPAAIWSAVIAPRGTSIIVPTRYLILTPCSFIASAATRSTIAF